jgi:hypothetical protein
MSTVTASRVTITLGYAGLIPFLLPAGLVLVGSSQAGIASQIAQSYALAILCFICGSWWGMAQRSAVSATLLLSNAWLLLALAIYLFASDWWALAAALLLAGAWLCEQNRLLFPDFPQAYRRMRAILTLLAGASMVVIYSYSRGI